jgi:hypothetical protein
MSVCDNALGIALIICLWKHFDSPSAFVKAQTYMSVCENAFGIARNNLSVCGNAFTVHLHL